MKLDFVANTRRNIIASFINKFVGMFFPFLRKTLFLWVLGPGYLGLNGLLYSLLGMLMLAELGFGTAIICYMYKPVADDDNDLLCAYLRLFRTIYRWVGAIIFVAGLCLLPFLRHLIHGEIPADVNLPLVYLLHLINTSASYFLFAYRGSILSAHHRNDVYNNIRTGTAIVEFGVVTLVLYFTRDYCSYVVTTIIFTLINNLLMVYATRKLFPAVTPRGRLAPGEIKKVISDVKAIFMHKIGAVVSGSFDNIVISSFLGLVAVAAFNNYYSICMAVSGLTGALCYSMMGGFGNRIYTEDRNDNFRLLLKANRMVMCSVLWCAAVLMALYQPFMALWTRHDPTLVRHLLTPVLMVILFYEKQARETLRMFKSAASLWRQDRWKAVVASLVNLSLNLLLINILPDEDKLDGVVLATIVSDLAVQMPWESYVVFSVFFNRRQAGIYWRSQLIHTVLAVLLCTAVYLAVNAIPPGGTGSVVLKGLAGMFMAGILLLALFRSDAVALLKAMTSRRRRN